MAKDWTKEVRDQAQRLVDVAQSLLARKAEYRVEGTNSKLWGLPRQEALAWDARVRALLSRPYIPTEYNSAFVKHCHFAYQPSDVEDGLPGLLALIADIDDGHVPSIDARARGETLSDLLEQAEARLSDHEHVAAVMLAGGVLEAHLRHLGDRRTVTIAGASAIGKWADALHAAGVLDRATKAAIIAWALMRNDADHLKATSFDEAAVRSMLVGVRTLLLTVPE